MFVCCLISESIPIQMYCFDKGHSTRFLLEHGLVRSAHCTPMVERKHVFWSIFLLYNTHAQLEGKAALRSVYMGTADPC